MKLRKLDIKDVGLMLEWMHDPSVVKDLQANFAEKTIDDCIQFIINAQNTEQNMHLAIIDDNDEYMGTVSLKNIDEEKAEFGITVRKKAMGKGFSGYAMEEILGIAFDSLNLKTVFWCVNSNNLRAIRFYDKNGYQRVDMRGKCVEGYTSMQVDSYIWYEIKHCC